MKTVSYGGGLNRLFNFFVIGQTFACTEKGFWKASSEKGRY